MRLVVLAILVVVAGVVVGFLLFSGRLVTPPGPPAAQSNQPRNLLLVTIDTLRADRVGAYGHAGATTPALDRVAREGIRFDHAYAPAPITLPSHASILTGRYPPGHGSRDNLMPLNAGIPTLATALKADGFQTAAFVAAFPLDRRFGLSPGFDVYSDLMPRAGGKVSSERPGHQVVDEALAWLAARRDGRFFLWVHLFEPHAPYGDRTAAGGASALERYDGEIATADEQVGRLLDGLGARLSETLVAVAGDHGESFGEHGEFGHSIFIYDTTLQVPWVMMGPGVPAGARSGDPVCLVDLAPTALALLGKGRLDADGLDLRPLFDGRRLTRADIYAESFAPLLEFGWSPLRSVRSGSWKTIAAPRPELYDVSQDPGETRDVATKHGTVVQQLLAKAGRFSPASLPARATAAAPDPETASRLSALGYLSRETYSAADTRMDPKDGRQLAARFGQVTSGELQGADLRTALEAIVGEDPGNAQAHLWLGDHKVRQGEFAIAARHLSAAIDAGLPSVDAHLGLAACHAALGDATAAERVLRQAREREPGNPVVLANLGNIEAASGREQAAIRSFNDALAIDADFHEVRFNLARAYARSGRRADAEREVRTLLTRLPANAPERPEVERLLAAVK